MQKKSFKILKGNIPVIISAPHASTHVRNGKEKDKEFATGKLAMYLHKKLGCHCIINKEFSEYDPNYDKNNKYQRELLKYIKENNILFLIDLHGCEEDNDFAIDIGTGGVKMKKFLSKVLPKYSLIGLPITYNRKFKAEKNNTITKFISASQNNCKCLQFEINARLRDYNNTDNVITLIVFMQDLIKNIINFNK